MRDIMEDSKNSAGTLLPPATTRWQTLRPVAAPREPHLAPPFVVHSPNDVAAQAERIETRVETPVEEVPIEALEEVGIATEFEVETVVDVAEVEEGVVRPAFEADTDAALEAFTFEATELAKRDDFPLEAFIVPQQTQRIPSGMEGKPLPAEPESTPVTSLADRLEKLSHRLRVEDTESVIRRLASGDRLDTMLAGLLAGYLAGTSEQK
jgi:hypothetical protein